MLLVKACRFGISPTVVNVFKQPVSSKPLLAQIQLTRLFANDARNSFTRSARKRITLVEEISKPAGETGMLIIPYLLLRKLGYFDQSIVPIQLSP